MIKKEVKIISCSKDSEYDFKNNALLYSFLAKTKIQCNIILNNTRSLAEVYNENLYKECNKDKILVFCHDDLLIGDLFFEEKLQHALDNFDIVGAAGCCGPISLNSPVSWHLAPTQPNKLAGSVAHIGKNNRVFVCSYGPTPARCLLIDGLIIAVNVEKLLEKELRFDENNKPGFHCYDSDFCLQANKLGLNIGVIHLNLVHKSLGDSIYSESFKISEKWLLKKWKSNQQ